MCLFNQVIDRHLIPTSFLTALCWRSCTQWNAPNPNNIWRILTQVICSTHVEFNYLKHNRKYLPQTREFAFNANQYLRAKRGVSFLLKHNSQIHAIICFVAVPRFSTSIALSPLGQHKQSNANKSVAYTMDSRYSRFWCVVSCENWRRCLKKGLGRGTTSLASSVTYFYAHMDV